MSDTSRIETREIADADLDNISAGLGVSGSVKDLEATFEPGANGVPVLTGGSIGSVTISVTDIPLGL